MSKIYESESVTRSTIAAKRRRGGLRGSLVGIIAGVVLATGGAAFAYMALTGGGTVQAEAYQAVPLTVSGGAAEKLYPGNTSDMALTIKNENPFEVKVTKVEAVAPYITDLTAGCNQAWITSTIANGTGYTFTTPVTIAANTTVTVNIQNALTLSSAADKGCGFKTPVKVTGSQSGN